MGKLMNPGLGDYLDRLSILELKIRHGQAAGKALLQLDHFFGEMDQIYHALDTNKVVVSITELRDAISLTIINALLWQCEDQMTAWRRTYNAQFPLSTGEDAAGDAQEIAGLGLRISELNAKRAAVIRAISAAGGAADLPEKL